VRWNTLAGSLLLLLLGVAQGCRLGDYEVNPALRSDTVRIAAADVPLNIGLPSAVDITGDGLGRIQGARFPERQIDAEEWDLTLRFRSGQLVLAPQQALGYDRLSAITDPLVGQAFDELREAPPARTFRGDRPVPVQLGAVYAVRSRAVYGGSCVQFGKLTPVEVDASTGRVLLRIVTNERCGDQRLAE